MAHVATQPQRKERGQVLLVREAKVTNPSQKRLAPLSLDKLLRGNFPQLRSANVARSQEIE
jgi:hypothetical protein